MSNVPWWGNSDGNEIGAQLGIKDFVFLNDFTANSYGLLIMEEDNFISLNGLSIRKDHTRGVLGPGTGLGNSIIFSAPFRKRERIYVLPSEGGHVDCPYINDQIAEYIQFMR